LSTHQEDLLGTTQMQMDESILRTAWNLVTYGLRYDHRAAAFSGGKDHQTTI
jgi:hypothetical protein